MKKKTGVDDSHFSPHSLTGCPSATVELGENHSLYLDSCAITPSVAADSPAGHGTAWRPLHQGESFASQTC